MLHTSGSGGWKDRQWAGLRRIQEVRSEGLEDLRDGLNVECGMGREGHLPTMAARFPA